jgi:hypothetical protein
MSHEAVPSWRVRELFRDGEVWDEGEIKDALADLLDVRRERDERNGWLAECYRQSGADPEDDEDWRLAPNAVGAIKELRADYDDACEEIFELARRAERAERELDELRIENGQICEKLAAAQRGEDIPGLVGRIAKAERELALARPVVEAAHYAAGVFSVLPLEQQGAHVQELVCAIRAYDAAREKGEGK